MDGTDRYGGRLPALFDAALDWIERHRQGRTEIWAVSDAQTTNWRPASLAWGDLGARLADMAPAPRIRALLADSASPAANRSIRADGVRRLDEQGFPMERATVEAVLTGPSGEPAPFVLAEIEGGWGTYRGVATVRESGAHTLAGVFSLYWLTRKMLGRI